MAGGLQYLVRARPAPVCPGLSLTHRTVHSLRLQNNIGQISQSLGGHDGQEDGFVSLFSIANSTGRMVAGLVSDK